MILSSWVLEIHCEGSGQVPCDAKGRFMSTSKAEAHQNATASGWDLTLELCPAHAQELNEKRSGWAEEAYAHYQAFLAGGPSLPESGWIDVDPATGEPLEKEKIK